MMQDPVYFVDIVFAIDLTVSMQPYIDKIKKCVCNYGTYFIERAKKINREIRQMRVRVLGFRDFYSDGFDAIEKSRTFIIPEEQDAFISYVNGLSLMGGGNGYSNSLEALSIAMSTDWNNPIAPFYKERDFIILFTCNDAYPIEKGTECENPFYPKYAPYKYPDLVAKWDSISNLDFGKKNLLVYTPDNIVHQKIEEDFPYSFFSPITSESDELFFVPEAFFDAIMDYHFF